MKADPGAVTYVRNALDEPHVFVRGDDDRLYLTFFDTRTGTWRRTDQGLAPGTRVGASPTAVVSVQDVEPLVRFVHAFVTGSNGHLVENVWDGSRWSWADHGSPNNATIVGGPDAVAYRRGGARFDELYAFCWGRDNLLYRFRRNGALWTVAAGRPNDPIPRLASEPSAVTHSLASTAIHAYVVGDDGRLHTHFSTDINATKWAWQDLGQPSDDTAVTANVRPALASFGGEQFAFVRGSGGGGDGDLWVHRMVSGGDTGKWEDLGQPSGTKIIGHPTVVESEFEGTRFLYVFVRGADRRLYVQRWDAHALTPWVPFGRPSTNGGDRPATPTGGNTEVVGSPVALTAGFEGTQRIYAFVRGGDGHLHVCFWNGSVWLWTDLDAVSSPAPRLAFTPTTLSFGSVSIRASARRTLSITNISGVSTTISIARSEPGPFQWPPVSATLEPAMTLPVVVDFTPHHDGNAVPTTPLRVTSNSTGSPHVITMRGTGIGGTPV